MMSRMPMIPENPLGLSWHDSAWVPMLNPSNVMDYFSERTNPFFDRSCNNELIKMQRLNPEQMNQMTGLEYILLHVQEPILYVIRKQHRHSPTHTTPLADYYIVAGIVYQAPDLASVINSRLLSTVHHLQSALEEASSYSRYHPSKGYSWDFKDRKFAEKKEKKELTKVEPSSLFQRQRVDMLLGELTRKFPLPRPPGLVPPPQQPEQEVKQEPKPDIKAEPKAEVNTNTNANANAITNASTNSNSKNMKPPPDKKPRLA